MGASEVGAFAAYRSSLSAFTTLPREEESALAIRYHAGDERAGARLISACLPFVVGIAMEYRRWGIPVEDLVQQGNVGLLRAARKFDATKECRLATYAAYWIRAEIREYVVRAYRVVRLGTTKSERRALRAYRRTGETNPEKLAAVSGLSVERVTELLPLLERRETSLDLSVGEGGSPMVDRMMSEGPDPEEATLRGETRSRAGRAVGEALAELSDRERMIIEERLLREDPVTLQELGVRLGVSKERVRQLEERARGKLKIRLAPLHDAA